MRSRHTSISVAIRLAMLGQRSLKEVGDSAQPAHLNLHGNQIGDVGTEKLVGVLTQYTVVDHLNLRDNQIGDIGAGSFTRVLGQCTVLTHLGLDFNHIDQTGTQSLSRVVWQCPALLQIHLHLDGNS